VECTKQLEERERRLRDSEERYRSFIEQSTEGIWRLKLEEPVPMGLRPDEQVERFYHHGYLAECNDAMARMYGYTQAEEIVGARLGDLFPPSIRKNVEYLKAFIRSGYQLTDAEFEEVDRHGDTKHFLSSLTGIAENEALGRVWGSQRDITERKQREEALQLSETRFRAIIEQSPLSIQILSPDGRTLEVNRAWEELWGVTLEDIAGYNLLEDQQLVTKGIMPYVQRGFAGEPTPIPPIIYDPNETIPGLTSREEPKRWVSAFIYPVRDEAGNVREVILMHDDITEHKQAEEVRARLAAIVESSDDAIIGKTLEAIITNWNRGAQKIYGYSAEEVVGKPINILVPPDRPDEIPKIMEKLRRGESINHYETVRITKDRRLLDVSLTISPIKDTAGNIVGASTIARDITERKGAEEARARQAHQETLRADVSYALSGSKTLQTMLQRCTEAMVQHLDAAFARVWTLNEEEGVLELQASAGMYTHTDGFHSRVPVGRFKIGLIAQERRPHLTNTVTRDPRVSDKEWAKREGMVAFAGYPLILEDRLVGVVAMFALKELEEDTIGALGSVADIIAQGIERKRAEEEIHRLNKQLERRVRQRTAQLAESNKELESFSYSVSHDLRAPLRHISGFAEMLQRRAGSTLDESSRRYLQTILESTEHAGVLIDSLLSFSRVGRAEMRSTVVDMDRLVREELNALRFETQERKISWRVGEVP